MTRRVFRLLWAGLALALLLCGCGGKEDRAFTLEDADTLLEDDGLFNTELAPIDASIAVRLYGIDEAAVTGCVSYQSASTSVSADELTIFILDNEAAATVAETACEKRVADQIAVCESYCPAAVPRLEGAVIRRLGNTVLLAVGDPDRLAGAVDGLH